MKSTWSFEARHGPPWGGEIANVMAGSFLYVPAGVAHRFHDIDEDLTVLVVFAPPEGSDSPTVG